MSFMPDVRSDLPVFLMPGQEHKMIDLSFTDQERAEVESYILEWLQDPIVEDAHWIYEEILKVVNNDTVTYDEWMIMVTILEAEERWDLIDRVREENSEPPRATEGI
jgi:hypothetical protein